MVTSIPTQRKANPPQPKANPTQRKAQLNPKPNPTQSQFTSIQIPTQRNAKANPTQSQPNLKSNLTSSTSRDGTLPHCPRYERSLPPISVCPPAAPSPITGQLLLHLCLGCRRCTQHHIQHRNLTPPTGGIHPPARGWQWGPHRALMAQVAGRQWSPLRSHGALTVYPQCPHGVPVVTAPRAQLTMCHHHPD